MSPVPHATWHNPRVVFVLLLVFLCGSLVGVLAMRIGFPSETRSPAAYWTQGGKRITLEHFRSDLDLSPEQEVEIERILDDFMMYYDTLQAQMEEVRANGKMRILRVLNPTQQQQFEQMLKESPVRQMH